MKLIKPFAVMAMSLALFACSSNKTVEDPAAQFKGQSETQIYNGAEAALIKGDYSKAIKYFEGLDALYPFGPHAQQAQLDVIYAYYKNDDIPSTLAAADRYLHLYPMGPHDDYAYYMRGLAQFYQNHGFLEKYFPTDYAQRNLGPMKGAFSDFNELVQRYPDSPYTPDARQRMIYIRNMLAQHVLEAANFYYERNSYVAAANRANEVVRYFQQSTSVPGALVLMTQSYLALGDLQNAQKSLAVLKLNFPKNANIPQLDKSILKLQGK